MTLLVDLFTPSDILHMVSIANKYKLLATDDKRYLIAFRMSSPWTGDAYQATHERKQRFAGVFSRFLHELGPGQTCDNPECGICNRIQALRADFHGTQTSREFALFLDWFQGSALGVPQAVPPAVEETTSVAALGPEPVAIPVPAADPLAAPVVVPTPAPLVSAQQSPESTILHGAFDEIPLFQCNPNHPAIRNFVGLLSRDSSMLDNDDVRKHCQALCQAGERLLGLLGVESGRDAETSLQA